MVVTFGVTRLMVVRLVVVSLGVTRLTVVTRERPEVWIKVR